MPNLNVTLSIGFANAEQRDILEIPQSEVDDCKTQEELEDFIDQLWKDWANNYIDGGAWFEEEL